MSMKHADAAEALPSEREWLLQWLTRLASMRTPQQTAVAIAELAGTHPQCRGASVLWGLVETLRHRGIVPVGWKSADWVWLSEAARADQPQWHAAQPWLALRLCRQPEPAMLLLSLLPHSSNADPSGAGLAGEWEAPLRFAGEHLQRALEWGRLQDSHQQLERSETLQRALFAISDLAGSDRDMPDMLRGIHAIVSTLMYADNFFIVLRNAYRGTVRFLYYVDVEDPAVPGNGQDMPMAAIEHTLTWHVMHDGNPRMGNAEQLRSQVIGPVALLGPDSQDWLGVPMLRDGLPVGALVVQSYQPEIGYAPDDLALLEFVGSHILNALERKQIKESLEQRVELRTRQLAEANRGLELEIVVRKRSEHLQAALFQIAKLATADIDQDAFYRRVHTVVGELLNAENFFIALLSDDRSRLTFPYAVDAAEMPPAQRPLGRGLSEYVLRRGTALRVLNADIEELVRQGEVAPGRVGAPATCWLGVPLIVNDEVIGLVTVQSYSTQVVYSAADQDLLSFVASQIANSLIRRRSAESLRRAYEQLEHRVEERTQALRKEIVERERIQDQLRHQVMHDSLTGLPNRGYLRDRIDHVLAMLKHAPKRRCALLYLDVDRFKIINDSLGHLAGDAVLVEVASRLAGCVRHPDLVARLAGDEFAILLEQLEQPALALSVAQRVLDALDAPMLIAGKELQITASVGIAIGDQHYHAADEVLRDADIALYRAKEKGRKRFELFDETLAQNVVDVLALEGELRQALQHDQFEPYFQPICRLDGGQVLGCEALIRWNHPLRGLLGPADFVKIAEDSGLIEAIDGRMFELSCRLLAQHGPPDTFMTFNVSARHLRHDDFDARLLQLLERTGLPPSRLIAEVTEGALLDNPERVRDILDRLRQAGVGAALDDFGTGYSSLSYLHSLHLRMLKIDQAFVHQLGDGGPGSPAGSRPTSSTPVVAAILALAHELNLQVIAEGIETSAQRDALLAMGCEMGQGNLLGRPALIAQWLQPHAAGTP